MKYTVILESSEEGYSASVPGLPGCHSQGVDEQEALENITIAIQEYLEVAAELGRGKLVREIENAFTMGNIVKDLGISNSDFLKLC